MDKVRRKAKGKRQKNEGKMHRLLPVNRRGEVCLAQLGGHP